jgi:D-alanyl-D-alanine carboxypeptidase (penicillin-binding protein 5/6)
MGIKRGEKLSLRELLYGMMVASADDASNVIAYALGNGSITKFMDGLNAYLAGLGCRDTFFNNPHGLYHPKHSTTAYDLALMAREAMKIPLFRTIVGSKRHTRPKTNKQESTLLLQTNRLLRSGEFFYPKAIGIKTGYVSKAGNTLVAAAKEGDRTLIAVLLNVKERKDLFREAAQLFEAAFNQPRVEKCLVNAGPQKYLLDLPNAAKPIKTAIADDVVLVYYPAEEPKIRAFIQWDSIAPPVSQGQKIGELHIKEGNRLLKRVELLAQEDVKLRWTQQLREWLFGSYVKIALWTALILGCFFMWRILRRN